MEGWQWQTKYADKVYIVNAACTCVHVCVGYVYYIIHAELLYLGRITCSVIQC